MSDFGSVRLATNKLFSMIVRLGLLLLGAVLLSSVTPADSVTYTLVVQSPLGLPGAWGPSGTLGNTAFGGSSNDAVLTFAFVGDTKNVLPFSLPGTSGYEILLGTASVLVTDAATGSIIAQGTFLPGAGVFVSVDNTHSSAGFGSFGLSPSSPDFPNAIQPVYPYGVQFGVGLKNYDLQSNFSLGPATFDSNMGVSCVNFPFCNSTTNPLALPTTAGNLYVNLAPSDATHGQFEDVNFTAQVGNSSKVPEPSSVLLLCIGIFALVCVSFKKSMEARQVVLPE